MIPAEFLGLYLTANAIGLAMLAAAIWAPRIARWAAVALFAWAAVVNTRTALGTPLVYLEYADLTVLEVYRTFILGWFSRHIELLVPAIAVGQAAIAVLLTMAHPWRRIGAIGAVVFLLAIAPLGVGSGFPFSLTVSAALLILDRRLGRAQPVPVRRAAA